MKVRYFLAVIISLNILPLMQTYKVRAVTTQTEEPTIRVTCSLEDIQGDSNKVDSITASVKFSWQSSNATFVYINGFDNRQHEAAGSIKKTGGGSYTFVAVGKHGIAMLPKSCTHTYKISPDKSKPVLLHSISYTFPEDDFKGSYKDTITTSSPKTGLEIKVTSYFQSLNYRIEADNGPPTLSDKDLLFHTSNYVDDPRLCDGSDCNVPMRGRKIARRVAFRIWFKFQGRQANVTTYYLHLLPSVLMNYPSQDDIWTLDPNPPAVVKVSEAVKAGLAAKLN
jgi:hypothetical protein